MDASSNRVDKYACAGFDPETQSCMRDECECDAADAIPKRVDDGLPIECLQCKVPLGGSSLALRSFDDESRCVQCVTGVGRVTPNRVPYSERYDHPYYPMPDQMDAYDAGWRDAMRQEHPPEAT